MDKTIKTSELSDKSKQELRLLINSLSVELALLNPYSEQRATVQLSIDNLRHALNAKERCKGPQR